ncbi:uncharacterized protein LOC116190071 [Punica granatum]|nr:uncharacterized protein LOC116190071 [Punica granatum]OWM81355.1 hypothetical protein CDL15_Pgr007393 [Punica granatum]
MSGDIHCFVEWKEQFVSQERGNRVVHYILKDSAGESVLAIVGTERSVRHMFYVVAEEFVESYGVQIGIHSGFKWRSRREVVDWLTSMISKPCDSPDNDSTRSMGSFEFPVNEAQVQGFAGSIRNGGNSEIVWSGTPWSCVKQLKHFQAFCRNGITIALYSFVFVMGKGETNYLAYLEDMYEDKRGQKKVKVRWFHRSEEVKGVTPVRNPHPKEVFITSYAQVISAECVDGLAAVLTKEHFFKCLAAFPQALSSKVHLCFRQFKNNRVKAFDLSKLRGYFNQPALSCLLSSPFLKPNSAKNGLIEEEDEDLSPSDDVKVGGKRARSGRGYQKSLTAYSGLRNSGEDLVTANCGPAKKKIRYAIAGNRLLSPKHVESNPCYAPLFSVGDKIETLCQDSGIRGCWFRCTVLQVTRKQLKVRYDDLLDEDGSGNLEEWIPAMKLAMPDKLGMRFSSRLTIRPIPPAVDESEVVFDLGVAVDAWWSDGWWEGIVTGLKADNLEDTLQVYFPGENLCMSLLKKDLRKSRDWVGDRWIDVQAKPDINSVITVESKLSASPTISENIKPDDNAAQDTEMNPGTGRTSADEMKIDSALTSVSCDSEIKDRTEGTQILPVEDEGNRDGGDHKISDGGGDNVKEGEKKESGTCDTLGDAPINDKNVKKEIEPSGENCKTLEISETVA